MILMKTTLRILPCDSNIYANRIKFLQNSLSGSSFCVHGIQFDLFCLSLIRWFDDPLRWHSPIECQHDSNWKNRKMSFYIYIYELIFIIYEFHVHRNRSWNRFSRLRKNMKTKRINLKLQISHRHFVLTDFDVQMGFMASLCIHVRSAGRSVRALGSKDQNKLNKQTPVTNRIKAVSWLPNREFTYKGVHLRWQNFLSASSSISFFRWFSFGIFTQRTMWIYLSRQKAETQ